MSESMTVEIGGDDGGAVPGPTERLARRERAPIDRHRQDEDQGPQITVDVGDQTDPMAALEDSRRALADRDKELAQARAEAQRERQSAAQARDQMARARRDRQDDQRAVAQSAQAAAEAKLAGAKAAYRTARETGDTEAEMEAQQAIAEATYEQRRAADYLAQYGAAGDQGNPTPEPAQNDGPTPEARAWIDAHPRFRSDAEYRAIALGAHNSAVQEGYLQNSPAYFRFIERTLARVFPEENTEHREQRDNREMTQNFNGAPPSRGGSGGGTGGRTVNTLFGPVGVVRRSNGSMQITIPPERRDDWAEAARINNMSMKDYVAEHINIRSEMDAGGNGGLITTEGATYR